jgi:hypothetical protein
VLRYSDTNQAPHRAVGAGYGEQVVAALYRRRQTDADATVPTVVDRNVQAHREAETDEVHTRDVTVRRD